MRVPSIPDGAGQGILDGYASSRASRRRQADIIRLLLLTGCRKGEIVNLRWREVERDTLNLADSKTGGYFPPTPVESLQCHTMPN